MQTRLTDVVRALDDQEFQMKLAAVEAAYANDETRQQLLVQAVELLKKAEAEGTDGPFTDSQMLSLAAQLVEEHIAKHAGEQPPAEGAGAAEEGLTEEEAEELYNLGLLSGEALKLAGMEEGDLEKVASDEESEALGRLAAQILLNLEENPEAQ